MTNSSIKVATIEDFQKIDVRVGKIIKVEDFPEARKPSFKLTIDFGKEIGIKRSSAQLVSLYKKEELEGKLVLGVVNLEPRQIGPFVSEVLTLGVPDDDHQCILIVPDKQSFSTNKQSLRSSTNRDLSAGLKEAKLGAKLY